MRRKPCFRDIENAENHGDQRNAQPREDHRDVDFERRLELHYFAVGPGMG